MRREDRPGPRKETTRRNVTQGAPVRGCILNSDWIGGLRAKRAHCSCTHSLHSTGGGGFLILGPLKRPPLHQLIFWRASQPELCPRGLCLCVPASIHLVCVTDELLAEDRVRDQFETMMETFVNDAASKVEDLRKKVDDLREVGPLRPPCPCPRPCPPLAQSQSLCHRTRTSDLSRPSPSPRPALSHPHL